MDLIIYETRKIDLCSDATKGLLINILRQFSEYVAHTILLNEVGIELSKSEVKALR